MRQFFCHLRLYRIQDQHYWTVGLRFEAESLGGLELQLRAFEAGLRVAGAGKLYLENVGIDAQPDGGHYSTVDDPNIHLELQYFLGLKRDRRHKAPPKTEERNEPDNSGVLQPEENWGVAEDKGEKDGSEDSTQPNA